MGPEFNIMKLTKKLLIIALQKYCYLRQVVKNGKKVIFFVLPCRLIFKQTCLKRNKTQFFSRTEAFIEAQRTRERDSLNKFVQPINKRQINTLAFVRNLKLISLGKKSGSMIRFFKKTNPFLICFCNRISLVNA